jgi:hypothetical protein
LAPESKVRPGYCGVVVEGDGAARSQEGIVCSLNMEVEVVAPDYQESGGEPRADEIRGERRSTVLRHIPVDMTRMSQSTLRIDAEHVSVPVMAAGTAHSERRGFSARLALGAPGVSSGDFYARNICQNSDRTFAEHHACSSAEERGAEKRVSPTRTHTKCLVGWFFVLCMPVSF